MGIHNRVTTLERKVSRRRVPIRPGQMTGPETRLAIDTVLAEHDQRERDLAEQMGPTAYAALKAEQAETKRVRDAFLMTVQIDPSWTWYTLLEESDKLTQDQRDALWLRLPVYKPYSEMADAAQ